MARPISPLPPLTDEQARLVRENLGLVGVHLRRNVANLAEPRRDREWEDLFQEGCLGLIRAAIRYQPDCGIPFPSYALPRIHQAVSRALRTRFRIVALPIEDGKKPDDRKASPQQTELNEPIKRPPVRVRAWPENSEGLEFRLAERRRHDPHLSHQATVSQDVETVGDRVRGKFDRAARAAEKVVSGMYSRRGDRTQLAGVLLKERLTVPEESERRALRQIARDTSSSFGRVYQTDRLLVRFIRQRLEADPEFCALRDSLRSNPDLPLQPLHEHTERMLADFAAREFVTRFRRARRAERAQMLLDVVTLSESNVEEYLENRVSRMSPLDREKALVGRRKSRRASQRNRPLNSDDSG